MNYTHRYIAKITIEAETPLAVGSGEKGLVTDRLVAKDANGLPYIPGTSLTGVLSHSFSDKNWTNEIFGFGGDKGKGSRLIISSAFLVGDDGKEVIEGLKNIDLSTGYYSYFNRLPERDHVRITHKGAADTKHRGKFDEEVVHKGTRFVFEIELIGNESDEENWNKLLNAFASPVYRIGGGTRKGFGKLRIIESRSKTKTFNLKNGDLKAYLGKSSSLNESIEDWDSLPISNMGKLDGWENYNLIIKPKDFFLFSTGFGDEDADNKPKTEKYFDWETGKPQLVEKEFILIPATSLKGALAHRVAFYYNKEKGQTIGNAGSVNLQTNLDINEILKKFEGKLNIENISLNSDSAKWEEIEDQIQDISVDELEGWQDFKNDLDEEVDKKEGTALPVGENNEAVKALFGYAKDTKGEKEGLRGSVILNDIYLPHNKYNDKVFNHIKIDRFTNGTIDGALFQEKATMYPEEFELEIWVEAKAFDDDNEIKYAFQKALEDLVTGQLPLGGNISKGHGIFQGQIIEKK